MLIAMLVLWNFQVPAADMADIMVTNARINESPPGINVTAGYLVIHNHGNTTLHLQGVESGSFDRVELHESQVRDGIATMVRQDIITIPPASSIELAPGGYHLMLFDPVGLLRSGDSISLTLRFSGDLLITTNAIVVRPGNGHGGMDHSQHY